MYWFGCITGFQHRYSKVFPILKAAVILLTISLYNNTAVVPR